MTSGTTLTNSTTNGPGRSDSGNNSNGPTAFQIGLGLMIVGASAGLTLYTKKTQAMLNQMKAVERNKRQRLPKAKFGPPTKDEWERMRNRWNDDD
eukprot:CAMPEP_0204645260 /NCGR_PEP_ID=MMETSP0718-20130828/2271_1 /ASSEMBLY_ACC=CAM_ASM_000674 /TAXON_ID=230516 /ORGANISM="Chaetoceros curvisetus" /LENGTH=94 /DNA_ID=CAMNT_0051667097 /DNA_START=19 /DNA_END=303 /DNA_ORIENTATION=-